jgi:hypothetical protein
MKAQFARSVRDSDRSASGRDGYSSYQPNGPFTTSRVIASGALRHVGDIDCDMRNRSGSRPRHRRKLDKEYPMSKNVRGATLGALGAFGANQQLRQQLANVNMCVLQQPEIYLAAADKLFDSEGNVMIDSTRDLLPSFINAFAAWIEPVATVAA